MEKAKVYVYVETNMYKTCVPSMIHSARPLIPDSSDRYSHLKVVLFCEIFKIKCVCTYGQTDGQRVRK